MGEKGEGSGGEGGGKWGERGRELGMGYPMTTPSDFVSSPCLKIKRKHRRDVKTSDQIQLTSAIGVKRVN